MIERLRAIEVALRGKILLGVIGRVDDSDETQTMQVTTMADRVIDKVLHLQPFGLSARAPDGSQALVIKLGGFSVVVAVNSPTHRPTDLDEGETVLHNASTQQVRLKSDRIVVAADDIRLGSDSASKAVLHEDLATAIATQVGLCTCPPGGGSLNTSAAFGPGWADAAKSTTTKTE